MEPSINPKFEKEFTGLIWQIKLDSYSGNLSIEVRNEDNLDIQFFQLDPKIPSLKELWTPDSLSWWSSLVASHGPYTMLNSFEDQKNPGPGKFLVLNQDAHRIEHDLDHFEFIGISSNDLIGRTITDKGMEEKVLKLNLQDGSNLKLNLEYPGFISPDSNDFQTIVEYLNEFGVQPVLGAEYFEVDENIILSYYVNSGRKFDRYICWLNSGNINLMHKIDEGMTGIAFESFLTFQNHLIFVENRSILKIYEI